MTVEIKDKLFKEITSYCEINNLEVEKYINDLLKKEFMIDKYGERPEVLEKPKPDVEAVDKVNDKVNVPEEDFNPKEMELNKALKDGVFDKELDDEPPVVVEEPKKKRRKLN